MATGGDTVKESTESPVRGRKIESKRGEKKSEETKAEGEQRGLQALFVGTVSQKSSSSSPFDLSLRPGLPLWSKDTGVYSIHTHAHTQRTLCQS